MASERRKIKKRSASKQPGEPMYYIAAWSSSEPLDHTTVHKAVRRLRDSDDADVVLLLRALDKVSQYETTDVLALQKTLAFLEAKNVEMAMSVLRSRLVGALNIDDSCIATCNLETCEIPHVHVKET